MIELALDLSGEFSREIHTPSTSMPLSIALMPKEMLSPWCTRRPSYRPTQVPTEILLLLLLCGKIGKPA